MPQFTSERSLRVLSELSQPLQSICAVAIQKIDFSLIDGLRTTEQQQAMYNATPRTSHLDGIVKRSKHQGYNGKSLAFDFIPVPFTTWDDRPLFTAYAHYFIGLGDAMGIQVRWGGDWDGDFRWTDQTFHDFPHIELMSNPLL